MAQRCAICGREPVVGCNVSHSHRRTKRRFMPNLQTIRVLHQGKSQRLRVCTRCIKANKVARVP